jgi:hypothetical protein
MVRKPQRCETGDARSAHLLDDRRDVLPHVDAFGELRIDEQTNLHDAWILCLKRLAFAEA